MNKSGKLAFVNSTKWFNTKSPVFPTQVSVFACVLLSIGGIALGMRDSSLAVQANGFIALIDIITSLLFMTAVSQTVRQPDYVFNYGYGKYESLAMLVGAFLLSIVLILTLGEALTDFGADSKVENHAVLLVFSVSSFVIIRFMSSYLARAANRYHVPLLKYDSELWHTDSFIELGVMANLSIGFILSYNGAQEVGKFIDTAFAILLVLYSLKVPLKHGKDALDQLLDRTLPEFIQFEILSVLAENLNKYCELKGVHTRQSGKDLFIEIDLIMPWDFTLEQIHEIEVVFNQSLKEKYPTSILRIYFTPCVRDCLLEDKQLCPVKLALRKLHDNQPTSQSE
jgi:cation diffusion facilitator family transporter